jgi:hypothetical protein
MIRYASDKYFELGESWKEQYQEILRSPSF